MRFYSALRQRTMRRLEEIERASVVVGIPCFNNDRTVASVVRVAAEGAVAVAPAGRAVVLIADGGSTDDSRDEAEIVQVAPGVETLVTIYRGLPGKGSAVRAIFEAARLLEARAVAIVDADLRSIVPAWIRNLLAPVLEHGKDFVAPLYRRYKFDGTITNNITYNLTRALYGCRIRQPIGGEFAFSQRAVRTYLSEDVWETDVARFGIDVWLTTTAVAARLAIAQARLGAKVHDEKDPAATLGPMFRQVVGTLLELMERHEESWTEVRGSAPVPIYGDPIEGAPEPFPIDRDKLVESFREGVERFGPLWRTLLRPETMAELERCAKMAPAEFRLPTELWVRVLYEFAAAYHGAQRFRRQLLDAMTPAYFGRIAGFVNRAGALSDDEAEKLVEEQAEKFEAAKPYLLERWREASERRAREAREADRRREPPPPR